jgi:hypothetical protein
MPTGNTGNWTQIFAEDFTTDVARGGFADAYGDRWSGYDGFTESAGNARYNDDIISVDNGVMDMYVHYQNGQRQAAAPIPLIDGQWGGTTYGRYSIRYRSDYVEGFKQSFMLWPDNDNWNDGEINFPEGGLGQEIYGFNHCIGNAASNCFWVKHTENTTDWHTATVEWTPNSISYILDGQTLGTTYDNIPRVPMHLILQLQGDNWYGTDTTGTGSVEVDWVTLYRWNG